MRFTGVVLSGDHDGDPPMQKFELREDLPEKDKTRVFLKLFLENQRRLYAYVLTLVPNRSDAEDVLQEVSFVLWEKFDSENVPDDFAAWGCRIAYFKVLELIRKKRRWKICFGQQMLERLSETLIEQSEVLQLEERREALASCITRLSEKDRDLLTQRFSKGASIESIASSLGRTVGALYQSLSRIRRALLECVNRSIAGMGYES